MNQLEFDELVAKEDIIECPSCGAFNAYAYQDSNMDSNSPHERYEDCADEPVDVYHIPSSSCWEWECGKCSTPWMERDSPLASECYTHVDYSEMEE